MRVGHMCATEDAFESERAALSHHVLSILGERIRTLADNEQGVIVHETALKCSDTYGEGNTWF